MANQVTDIVQRLVYESDTTSFEAIDKAFNRQLTSIKQLEQENLNLNRILEQTNTRDLAQRRAINAAIRQNRQAIDELTASVGRQLAGSERLQRSLSRTTSQLQGLSFAGSQLLREAPAFAFSIQTGILALSNNIPILIDQLNAARAAGSSTTQIFRALGSSVFGITGIITIAVSALTIFGDKLFGSSKAAKEASASIDQATDSLDKYAKVLRDVANLNDEGANAAKRELELIKARSEAYDSAFKKDKAIHDGE